MFILSDAEFYDQKPAKLTTFASASVELYVFGANWQILAH